MTLQKGEKVEIIKKFQSHKGLNDRSNVSDTGCLEVQVALWTHRIKYLTEHFKTHKKDHHSRRGLIQLVNKRRKSLDYLKRKSFERYKALLAKLNIRK